jgi:triacylglycerol lipase
MTPLDAAKLAQAAYTTAPTVGLEGGPARFVFSPDGKTCSIPGTNNASCVKTDIEFLPTAHPGLGSVHNGFMTALESQLSALAEYAPEIILGHSEGASLAGLYAGWLCLQGKPPKTVFGFEPAKTSIDNTLAMLLFKSGVDCYLTQNGNDVVPLLPLQVIFMDWQHFGLVTDIGKPLEPFLNLRDHEIANVILSLE